MLISKQDAHTGTTPFVNRADALLLASKLILHSHRAATSHNALASTGILKLAPGSTNTIPGLVKFSLDVRAPHDDTVEAVEADLKRDFASIAAGEDVGGLHTGGIRGRYALEVNWTTDSETSATHFHPDCIQCVHEAATETLKGSPVISSKNRPEDLVRYMISGAGHDSVYTSRHCPTSMIFIPCRDGVSHNPTEYSTPEDCELGAQVILQAVLKYDRLRMEQGQGHENIH